MASRPPQPSRPSQNAITNRPKAMQTTGKKSSPVKTGAPVGKNRPPTNSNLARHVRAGHSGGRGHAAAIPKNDIVKKMIAMLPASITPQQKKAVTAQTQAVANKQAYSVAHNGGSNYGAAYTGPRTTPPPARQPASADNQSTDTTTGGNPVTPPDVPVVYPDVPPPAGTQPPYAGANHVDVNDMANESIMAQQSRMRGFKPAGMAARNINSEWRSNNGKWFSALQGQLKTPAAKPATLKKNMYGNPSMYRPTNRFSIGS